MAKIHRLTDSCLRLVTDEAATLFDPGFHTFLEGEVDLASIGEVTRVLITHEHADHVHPDFVAWLIDRGDDVTVHSNAAVAEILSRHDIESSPVVPPGVEFEDVLHEALPDGSQPPNRSYTVEGLLTHPGDSRQPTTTAPILALPLIAPWDSLTGAVAFARRLRPTSVLAVHDFYLSAAGRARLRGMAAHFLGDSGIEVLDLDWGQEMTI